MQLFVREARLLFVFTAALAAVLFSLQWFFLFSLAVAFFIVALFLLREPKRNPPPRALDVLSPIDGFVLGCETTRDPFLNRPALRIRMEQSWFGANVVFSPTEGKFEQFWGVDNDIAPGHIVLWFRTDENDDVILDIKTRKAAKPRPWFNWIKLTVCSPGERVGQGQRLGFIGPVAECSLYLADSSKLLVEAEQPIYAAEQSLAQFRH